MSKPNWTIVVSAQRHQRWQQQQYYRRAFAPGYTISSRRCCCCLFSHFPLLVLLLLAPPSSSSSSSSPPTISTPSPQISSATPPTAQFLPDERVLLRQTFLRKFGLETLGEAIEGGEGRRSDGRRVPQYVWTLYEKHNPEEADTIRHYENSANVQKDGILWMTFNLSATERDPSKEQIVRVELRLPNLTTTMTKNGTIGRIHKVNGSGEHPKNEGIELIIGRTGCVEVGPLLEGHHSDQLTLALILAPVAGTVQQHFGTDRPFDSIALIVYADSAGGKRKGAKRRRKRGISKELEGERSGSGGPSSEAAATSGRQPRKHRRHHHHQKQNSQQCRRTELYVDFSELNWMDWIMAPAGYEAYQCRGRCTHPMPSNLNTTNHAIVQSLIHSIDPSAVPAPSCVPVQMSAISILYKDLNNVIVVKTYADMRVDACGCH